MMMIVVCVILAFQFFAIIDSHTVTINHGETGLVNCTSGQYPGRINIAYVDFKNILCNTSRHEVGSFISIQCHNLTECFIDFKDAIPCHENDTTNAFIEIWYECAVDGGWSEWNEFSACSLTCGGGVKSRHRKCNKPVPNDYGRNCSGLAVEEKACNTHNCSNPYSLTYSEGEMAHLTCSAAFYEEIIISSISYYQGSCNHTNIFGIQNLCNHKSVCSFEVSNSNVGSSCGKDGKASFDLVYYCKRNGGWSEWMNIGSCTASCGGGVQNRFRECTNPAPNEAGNNCIGDNSTQQICNNQNCIQLNTSCINETVIWTCSGGYINVDSALWRTRTTGMCGTTQSYKNVDVTALMQKTCSYRTKCMFHVEDSTFQINESIYTEFYYIYTCYKAQWGAWSEWGDCSISCGNGLQWRTRSCPDQTNTTDGYQVGCEGDSAESKHCLVKKCSCSPPVFHPYLTNVEIPDHTKVDSLIINLPVLEPDYSNFWQYFEFDYKNEYFYIDTRLRSLRVKKAFPHLQGQRNTTHEYNLTVVDSCSNTVRSSISVVSYNAPPIVTGLEDIIRIDLSILGNSSYLTSFQVTDPSGDNVSCTIKETIPPIANVLLNFSDNDMILHLSENTSFAIATISKISIRIVCSDGTTTIEIQPVITFISGEEYKFNRTDTAVIVAPLVIGIILIILAVVATWYYIKRRRMLMSVKKLSDYVVTHKLSSDDEDDLGEINPASQHKDENEHAYTSLPKADENKSSNSASFKLAATKGEYVEAWR